MVTLPSSHRQLEGKRSFYFKTYGLLIIYMTFFPAMWLGPEEKPIKYLFN